MKKNVLQKVLATALVGAMAMGTLTACGGSDSASKDNKESSTTTESSSTTTPESSSAASTDAASSDAAPVAGIDGWEPFANNVTVSIPVYNRGAEGVPAIGENYWETWVQENFGDKYNITMEFVPITRSDVLTDYALLAAADDLPTILMEYDYPKQAQWAADGYLTTYDLDEFKQIAPTYYDQMVENNQLTYTEMAGETYFVLAERPYYNTNYTWVTLYREDWLKQIGYDSYPETWAEEKVMLQKLVDEGICANPLGGSKVTGAGVDQNYGYRTYPLDGENWAGYGDYAIPALGDAANKALLKRVNEQYNLGFIDPEFDLTDAETAKANFINGKALAYSGYISANMDWVTAFYENNPDADLAVRMQGTEVDAEGGVTPAFRANNPFGMMISFSSQATADEIKGAMMYMEWMCQEENLFTMQWGFEGEHFAYGDNGLPASIPDYAGDKKQGYNNSKDYWCVVIEARSAGTIEDMIKVSSPAGIPEDFSQDIIDNYYLQLEVAKKNWAVSDCLFSVSIESVSEYQATLLSLYEEYRVKLTKCDPAEFDKLYDEYAKKYWDAGYGEIVEERIAAYNAGSSTKLPY